MCGLLSDFRLTLYYEGTNNYTAQTTVLSDTVYKDVPIVFLCGRLEVKSSYGPALTSGRCAHAAPWRTLGFGSKHTTVQISHWGGRTHCTSLILVRPIDSDELRLVLREWVPGINTRRIP